MIKNLFLKLIKLYQVFISPHLGQRCRFYPSCSEYARQTIEKYGLVRGLHLGLKRIFKCHPWNPGGIDMP